MTTKRFGARYGRRNKEKLGKIEAELRKKHKCPYCNKIAVKRQSYGIWHCTKCLKKFTGKAYSIKEEIIFEKKGSGAIKEKDKKEVPQNG